MARQAGQAALTPEQVTDFEGRYQASLTDRKVLWWYETSNTWSAADWLMMYAAQYTEFEFRSNPTNLERGDFFLVDLRDNNNPSGPPDGKPDHGRVIVGYGYTSTNQADYSSFVQLEGAYDEFSARRW